MTRWLRRAAVSTVILSGLVPFGGVTAAKGETASASSARSGAHSRGAMCDTKAFRVVLDVGHTADVPGAKSARGVYEYAFNLRLARVIERDLVAAGFTRTVFMVTVEPPPRGLFKRVIRAHRLSADLFLSIHHDSVPDWFLKRWTYQGVERSYSDRFRGHSLFISRYNGARRASLMFARLLGRELRAHGLQYAPHYTERFMGHRRRRLVDREAGVYLYDKLIVLKHTRVPAVLLEAGSIINRDEELLMATPERQSAISAAVTNAVRAFCAIRTPRKKGRRLVHRPVPLPLARPAIAPSAIAAPAVAGPPIPYAR